jgi:FtsP/CotA-like multicopper oxidase with cupredoxin domain
MKRALIYVAIAGVLGIAGTPPAAAQGVQIPMDPASIPKFVNELPLLGPTGLPVLDGTTPSIVSICEFQTQILPPPFGKTWVWGYQIGDTCVQKPNHSYIGPVVVALRGTPTQMTFINQLGNSWQSNVLAYTQNTDQTMHWADPLNAEFNQCAKTLSLYGEAPVGECANNYVGPIPAAVHLHGGEIPPNLDGGPDSWFTGNGRYRGHGYYTREVNALPTLPHTDFPIGVMVRDIPSGDYYVNKQNDKWKKVSKKNKTTIDRATYVYPNTQEAANIWFHDHVLGFTRLNVYAGIAGAYVITDPANVHQFLQDPTELVPLVIQDRMFDTNGELYLSSPGGNTTPEHPFWVAEFIGDVAVVNGQAWPTLKVEPKKYRFLFLNGSNSVGYNLFVENAQNGQPGPPLWVVGTDGGFLNRPAMAYNPGFNPQSPSYGTPNAKLVGEKLVLLPGERYEVIIDFAGYAGTTLEMRNDAWNPYPFGDAPPIAQIMQLEVVTDPSQATAGLKATNFDPTSMIPRVHPIVDLTPLAQNPTVYRQLTLNELESTISGAPLEALLNNTKWDGMQVIEDGPPNTITTRGDFVQSGDYSVPTFYSERPDEGSMEVWDIINITADAHPIHLHLVQFQVLERIPFDDLAYFDAYEAAFVANMNPGYMPAYGPPNNYNIPNLAGAIGGNPDPMPFEIALSARGPRRGPEPHEAGWKDTVVTYPGEITKIAVRFAPTDIPNDVTDPAALGYPFDPDDGHGYVWHCHILDHEDNEMMRPTEVLTNEDFVGRTFDKGEDY